MDPTEDSERKTKEDIHKKRYREDRQGLYQDKVVRKDLTEHSGRKIRRGYSERDRIDY